MVDRYIKMLHEQGFETAKTPAGVMVKNKDLTILGRSDNTYWTVHGVLCDEAYAFSSEQNFIVLDIGFNIGVASLYYALKKNVTHIYAFEPFEPTYKQGLINLEINKHLSNKITPHNFGLGSQNGFVGISYNPERPGSMSSVVDRYAGSTQIEKIEIKNASEVCGPIFNRHTEKILLKIDCEGAEKEILATLSKDNLLQKVHAIAMEWHFTPPVYINRILNKNNFFVFYNNINPGKLGMAYAFKA